MANRIRPRLAYIVAVEVLGDDCYRFFANDRYSCWSYFQDFAERFDSIGDAMAIAKYIPGAFVATLLPSAD